MNPRGVFQRAASFVQALFENLFDFQLLNTVGDLLVSLSDGHGLMFNLANATRFGEEALRYPEPFHIGFNLDDLAQVDDMYERVLAAGIATGHTPRKKHGHYGFSLRALDGLLFEVATHNE